MWGLAYGHGHPRCRARQSTRRADGGPTEGARRRAGRPLLAHVFETAIEAGADELVIIVGYEVATVRMGERVNVNTSDDVEQASELVGGESKTSS